MEKKGIKKTKQEKVKTAQVNYPKARMYIQSSFNNTIITFANLKGDTLFWVSTGMVGFKGARRQTPFAATTTVETALKKAGLFGIRELEVYIKGPGSGRDAALRVLRGSNFRISLIADVTPIPHNGPRPKKRRRI